MDYSTITYNINNIYIPRHNCQQPIGVPAFHPCLVIHDKQTDTGNLKPCGCPGPHCIINTDWIPKPSP